MDILLINPRFSIEDLYGKASRIYPVTIPLGLAYLGGYLEKHFMNVGIIDGQLLSNTEIRQNIVVHRPKVVGITSNTTNFPNAIEVARMVKEVDKEITTVIGGSHPSALPEKTLENECIDLVVRGEGEVTLLQIVGAIKHGKDIFDIDGTCYRKNGKIKHARPRAPIVDLDTLPFPARHLLPMGKYNTALPPSTLLKKPISTMITSRGCPYNCIFCAGRCVYGHHLRRHSNRRIVEEMEHLIEDYGTKEIFFLDDLFVYDAKETEELCDMIIEGNICEELVWVCCARVDKVEPLLLKKMQKAGCRYIIYGIETASHRLMKLIKKGVTAEQAKNAVKWTKETGIKVSGTFILGLPTETLEESLQTIEYAKQLDVDYAQFSIATPYPGTEFYEMVKDHISENWFEYDNLGYMHSSRSPIYVPEGRTAEDLKKLQRRASMEFYLRPKKLIQVIGAIRNTNQFKSYLENFIVQKYYKE